MRRIVWCGNSLEEVRSFPEAARQDVGYQLGRVQQGLQPRDWKPMPTVGAGVIEIRIHAENEYRVLYLARSEDGIHVLRAFVKKSQQTKKSDIELTRKRFCELTGTGSQSGLRHLGTH